MQDFTLGRNRYMDQIERFDKIIKKVSMLDNQPLFSQFRNSSIADFITYYRKSSTYVNEKEKYLTMSLIDIRLELLYIEDVDLKFYGDIFTRDFNYENHNVDIDPYTYIKFLSFTQSEILKSRILFERIMNFIYYFCTGIELENKKVKSKKGEFFKKLVFDTSFYKWKFIAPYEKVILRYDELLRTSEVHKKSTLRSFLLDDEIRKKSSILANQVIIILNLVMTNFWKYLFVILEDKEIDPKEVSQIERQCITSLEFLNI